MERLIDGAALPGDGLAVAAVEEETRAFALVGVHRGVVMIVDADLRIGGENEKILEHGGFACVGVGDGGVPVEAGVAVFVGAVLKARDLCAGEHDADVIGNASARRGGVLGEAQAVVIGIGVVLGAGAVFRNELLQTLAGGRHAVYAAGVRVLREAEARAVILVDVDIVVVHKIREHRRGVFETVGAEAAVGKNRIIGKRGADKVGAAAADRGDVVHIVQVHENEHVAGDLLDLRFVNDGGLADAALLNGRDGRIPVVVLHHDRHGACLAVVLGRGLAGQGVDERRVGCRLGRRSRFGRGGRLGRGLRRDVGRRLGRRGRFRFGRYVRTVGARAENERAYEKQRKYGQKLALHSVTS